MISFIVLSKLDVLCFLDLTTTKANNLSPALLRSEDLGRELEVLEGYFTGLPCVRQDSVWGSCRGIYKGLELEGINTQEAHDESNLYGLRCVTFDLSCVGHKRAG